MSDRGAQADFSVPPRLGLITAPCLEPPPVGLIPECSGEEKKRKRVIPNRLATSESTCSRCGLDARAAAAGSGGFTRRGCDHGPRVAPAAAPSSPAGLLHPHGQTQTLLTAFIRTLFVFLTKV